jgi:phage FluMu protein gp41
MVLAKSAGSSAFVNCVYSRAKWLAPPLDADGNLHRKGVMRLSWAIDEILPMRDPRVKANPAYATVLILARVITKLGALEGVSPAVIEQLFAVDLSFLQKFYRQINGLLEEEATKPSSADGGSEQGS